MTSEVGAVVVVGRGDSLSKIASRHRVSVQEILDENPNIVDRNALSIGQRIKIPGTQIDFTVRFVNLADQPPVGVRYRILDRTVEVASGTVSASNSEANFFIKEGVKLSLLTQIIGEHESKKVGEIIASRRHPVMLLRINSARLPSSTELHPRRHGSVAPNTTRAAAPASRSVPRTGPESRRTDQGIDHARTANRDSYPEHALLPGACCCSKDISVEQLLTIFPSRRKAALELFVGPLNLMMKNYSIDSCLRKSHAIAQIGCESGGFRYTAEVLKRGVNEADVYDGYKGRGLIQITFKKNYERYGRFVGNDFLGANKVKLETIGPATDSAGWFWNHGAPEDLNIYADKNDLIQIACYINGAFNGFSEREEIFKRAHYALRAHACGTPENRSATYLSFEQSKIYGKRDAAFAWAFWHDPRSSKVGVLKDLGKSKAAYRRFLELARDNPARRPRFGFRTVEEMAEYATERLT